MLRSFVICICLIAMGCATTTGPERKKRSVLHSKIGTALLQNGKLPQALGELLKATELDPENVIAHNNLALVYLLREKPKLSEGHLRTAIAVEPTYTEARNNLGRVLVELKKYDEAIKHLKIASQDLQYTSPQKTYSNLGLAYFNKGSLLEAREALEKSLAYEKNRCVSLNLYGKILFKQKDFDAASTSFDQAINSCSENSFAEPHYFAGLSYYKSGKQNLAKARFEEVIKLFPTSMYGTRAKKALKTIK